ncbi:PREDICTED: uncharacterized protein LOC109114867 [Nelumbo nucifera]|uniref:Uncharacterized protein LOC109114867 n=1 Tax=Nelumbo nucifera TaxID=4432 RepID=A0A1U8Q4M0_NELNU|nr:PREDICTED: uncharacterized protein LOC109114867 [Nelumbo nucifera]
MVIIPAVTVLVGIVPNGYSSGGYSSNSYSSGGYNSGWLHFLGVNHYCPYPLFSVVGDVLNYFFCWREMRGFCSYYHNGTMDGLIDTNYSFVADKEKGDEDARFKEIYCGICHCHLHSLTLSLEEVQIPIYIM